MKLTPVGERVILTAPKRAEKTAKGIYLPESKDEKKEGIIVAVGKTADGKALPLNINAHVIYAGYSASEIEFEEQKYIVVDYKDIVAIVGDQK